MQARHLYPKAVKVDQARKERRRRDMDLFDDAHDKPGERADSRRKDERCVLRMLHGDAFSCLAGNVVDHFNRDTAVDKTEKRWVVYGDGKERFWMRQARH